MATQLEISTVAAVKSVQTLRQQSAALSGTLKELTRTLTTLNSKMSRGAGAQKLSAGQKKAAGDARLLSKEMLRQKNAVASTKQQFLNLNQSLKLAKSDAVNISNLGRSFTALEKRMKSGKLTANQYATAMNRWRASMGTARRELKKSGVKQAAKEARGLSHSLRNLGSSAVFAVGPLSGVGARITAFSAIATRATIKVAAITLGFVALGVAAFKTVKAMIGVAIEMNKINNALKAAVGSAEGANLEFKFLVATSRELSLDLSAVGLQFAQLAAAARGTSLAGAGVRKIFKAVSTASVVLGLGADQAAGALRAIQQMMSKGTVQAEELRGQLGERIPGAFQIAARAMGVTTRELGKMLEQGLVVAEELLPKMADELEKTFGPQVEDAVGQIGAAVQRLKTEFTLFFQLLEENTGLVQDFADILNTMGRGVEILNNAMSGAGLQGQLDDVNKALEDNAKKTARATGLLKAAAGAWLSSEANVRKYKDQLLALTFESIRLTQEQKKLQNQLNAQGETFGPAAPALTFGELRNLPVASVDELKNSLLDMRGVLESLADPGLSLENKLGIVSTFKNAGEAATKVAKILKGLSQNELTALRTRVDGSLRSMQELRDMLLSLVTRYAEVKKSISETTQELKRQSKAFEAIRNGVEALERINEARRNGEAARLAMIQQIDLEIQLRKLNVTAVSAEGQALAALIARKHEAIAVAKALNEEEATALRVAKKLEALRDKQAAKAKSASEALETLKQSNVILRMRIDGMNDEADAMELRNKLEEKYGKALGGTIDKIIAATAENEALKESLGQIMEVKEAISSGFKQMGSDIASAIREGKSLVDVLVNSFGNLLEKLLEIAIQMLIIGPLMKSMGLPGGSSSPATIFGIGTNMLGLPSANGNVFQGGNVVPFKNGGVINSPANFSMSNGGLGSIAEEGPEAIMPLKKSSSGKLGVEASGMGAPVVNFYLAPGTNVREFNEAQPQIAAMLAGTMASASASNN